MDLSEIVRPLKSLAVLFMTNQPIINYETNYKFDIYG